MFMPVFTDREHVKGLHNRINMKVVSGFPPGYRPWRWLLTLIFFFYNLIYILWNQMISTSPAAARSPSVGGEMYFKTPQASSCSVFRRATRTLTNRCPPRWCTSGAWWTLSWRPTWWRPCRSLVPSGNISSLQTLCVSRSLCILHGSK